MKLIKSIYFKYKVYQANRKMRVQNVELEVQMRKLIECSPTGLEQIKRTINNKAE